MFRPPSEAGGAAPIELIGLEPDTELSATDVEFGRRHHHGDPVSTRSHRNVWWAVGAAGLLAVAAFVFGSHSDKHASPPTTSPSTVATPSTVPRLSVIGPVLADGNGWGLFLVDKALPNVLLRLDLGSGVVKRTPKSATVHFLAFSGNGVTTDVIQPDDVGGSDQIADGPDGDIWVNGLDPVTKTLPGLRLMQVHPGEAPTILADYAAQPTDFLLTTLLGSLASGDPVMAAPDGTAYVWNPERGTKYRLTTGTITSRVVHGNYTDVECDATAHCDLVLHAGARTARYAYTNELRSSISPDGKHAVVGGFANYQHYWHIIDMTTGHDIGSQPTFDAASDGTTAGLPDPANVVWTPDGASALLFDSHRVLTLGADGTYSVGPLPPEITAGRTLLGIG